MVKKTTRKLLFATELAVAFITYETFEALRSSCFWDVTRKSLVASCRRLGTTCWALF